ncbi:hypothetical protein K439DRAFT_1661690 [Ramaria rubella]|nr:hypothetical protein K439DRAFT_1661690 [Ramaria rubella]
MADDDHATLPAYEPHTNRTSTLAPTQTSSPQPPPVSAQPSAALLASVNRDLDTSSYFGGGGVRIPLTATEKEREDLRSLSHLASFGVQLWVRGFDEEYQWDPCACYKAAAAQLDILLPLLSPPNGQLPSTTALRTVLIRLPDLPSADLGHFSVCEGRDEISRALRTWLMKPTVEPASIYSFADVLVRRVRNEGFVVVQEWWEFNGGFVQLVVRC